jgi:predicted ribosomally synthesized peptide with SipW-like signal peptide
MKKILGLTVAALLIMGLVGGGTWAYFSDVETSGTNVLTAGTLNLQVGAVDPMTANISLPALKPGSSGNANGGGWTVLNDSTISGNLTIAISAITNGEGDNPEPETGNTAEPGELGGLCEIAIWLDNNQAGGWDSGDQYLASGGTVVAWGAAETEVPPAAYDTIDSFGSVDWAEADGIATMGAAADFDFMVEYDFPDGGASDNDAQGDNCTFTIDFTLIQE